MQYKSAELKKKEALDCNTYLSHNEVKHFIVCTWVNPQTV